MGHRRHPPCPETPGDARRRRLCHLRTNHVKSLGAGLLSNEIDSWMTGVNSNIHGRQTRIVARHSGGAPAYRERRGQVAADGDRELSIA